MKLRILTSLATVAFASTAFANSHHYSNDAYVGAEAIQTNQNYKQGYGKNVLKKNTQDYSVFAGFNFTSHFGVELGYDFQPKRHQNPTLVYGDVAPGNVAILPGEFIQMESSIKSSNPYLGVFVDKTVHKFKLQAILGLAVSRVKAYSAILADENGTLSQANYELSKRNYNKTKVVPMVKLAGTYMVSHSFGLRATLNYRNMSSFKIKSNVTTSPAEVRLKDMLGVGLGLTYSM